MDNMIVTLFSAEWCAPCKRVKPSLQGLSQEMGFHLDIVDIDQQPEAGSALNVMSVPTVVGFLVTEVNGVNTINEVGRCGALTKSQLQTTIQSWVPAS